MAKSKNTGGCGTFFILLAILYAIAQFIEENYVTICIVLGIVIFLILIYVVSKHKKKLKATQSKMDTINESQKNYSSNVQHDYTNIDPFIESQKKYLSSIQLDRANSLINRAHHLTDILNTTVDREEFYISFDELTSVLKTLSEFEGKINFLNALPSEELQRINDRKQASIDFLERRIKEAESKPQNNFDIIPETVSEKRGEIDPYFASAGRFVIEKEVASIGMLQRLFKIGFNRAARIMDQLYIAGVVGPEEGASPRKVLMTVDEFEKYLKDIASNGELEKEVQSINSNAPKNNVDKSNIFSAIGITCDYSHSGKNLSFLCNILVTHVAPGYSKIFINNLLQENSAEDLSIILCDLSMSGFEIYNGIPNLFIPVVNTIDKTYGALGWLYEEMKYRTTLLLEHKARNIDIYNQYADKKLNKLVYIIDEIFYLQNNSKKFESLIPLLLNCNRMGLYVIFFSKFDLKNLDLGKVKDLITVYDEQIPFAITSYLEQSGSDHKTNYDLMNGIEFEVFCKSVLQANGFKNLRTTKGSGDQGIDLLAEKEGIKYGIQCKCYSSDIGNKAVQEAFAGKTYYGCHVAAVLTNRHFTRSAKALADSNHVLLWDREKLEELILKANI